MHEFETKLREYVDEFKKIPAEQYISNPYERVVIGTLSISRRALKHFVEQRLKQNADINTAVSHLLDTIQTPEINIPDPGENRSLGSRYLGKLLPSEKKALMIAVDGNNEICSIHFKRMKDFNKLLLKNQKPTSGGAADPSSFLL